MNSFKEKLQNKFVITCEFVPGRGSKEKSIDEVIEFAKQAKEKKLPIDAISITDNPGGNPAISPDVLGKELLDIGIEPLIHFSCANNNRNFIESRAYALARQGINNLLVVTGDYPTSGYKGMAKPSFDMDSVQLIEYLKQMNNGLKIPSFKKDFEILSPTNFVIGCAVSPFKKTEAELLTQFFKLEKKIKSGADFIIPQLGYDFIKIMEIIKYLKYKNINLPILGNVYVMTLSVAKLMNKNFIPGCIITDEFLKKLTEESKSSDKGKNAKLERASQMVAIFKGLGFNGVHIGGFGLKISDIEFILSRSKEIENSWQNYLENFQYNQQNEFYLFSKDFSSGSPKNTPSLETGMNCHNPLQRKSPAIYEKENSLEKLKLNKKTKFKKSICFQMMKIFHNLMFESIGLYIGKKISPILEKNKFLYKISYCLEKISKQILFDCQECGDCALPDTAYFCPMSQCAKFQRNGPCGGSYHGFCEVHKEKRCVWTLIYERLSAENKLSLIEKEIIPPPNVSLSHTSSWTNFFMEKDHTSKKN
ncbi:MAG: methylenetetrahydrofolate reductase C-terminal domain-containing protein [bacterium]